MVNGRADNDIAMVYLSKNVSSSRVLPLCSAHYEHSLIAVCGFGYTTISPRQHPKVLQEMKVREINDKYCPSNNKVCLVEDKNRASTCGGDSGGPAYPLTQRGSPVPLWNIELR
ncbi:trypsin-like [Symsagittifera roscoffensis]|uniref:trypsin-like n=1 Tax=Symsagittifera roscoffensis TaxID=84072 RepID=UPI00307BECE7